MPDVCSCGTPLAPDSLFCHKCGKAQRDIVEPELLPRPRTEAVIDAPAAPVVAAAIPPLNFHNPLAVRIALLVAVVATLLNALPFVNWAAAGFFSVLFYKRKTGSLLNVNAGVRMGWLTGLLMFALWSVLFMIKTVPEALSGNLSKLMLDRLQHLPAQDPMVTQMVAFFQSGAGLAMILIVGLCIFFCFITGLSMAGGAIGAKMMGRNST